MLFCYRQSDDGTSPSKVFRDVAEELNISRASARLRVSQPAVSRQIRDLEDEVGAKLFIRDPTGLKLTAAGETFFAHARDILRRSAESLKAMQAFGKRTSEAITLSYIPTALPSFLTGALRTFGDQHPNVAVHLREMPPRQQIDALRKGEVDMAFIGNPCRELKNEFDLAVLKRVLISVALPDNHLLALRKQVELSKLSEEEFIGLSEDRFPGRNAFICETCQAAGFTPRINWKADSLSSMLALVATGKGVALLPTDVENLPHPHTVFIPLKGCAAKIEWAVAWRKEQKREVIASLLKLLKA